MLGIDFMPSSLQAQTSSGLKALKIIWNTQRQLNLSRHYLHYMTEAFTSWAERPV